MREQEIITGVLVNGHSLFTFVEVCQRCQLSEEVLVDWLAHGLLGQKNATDFEMVQFDNLMVERIRTAHRLQHDLEVNIQGAILALELLDQITDLKAQLTLLKRS